MYSTENIVYGSKWRVDRTKRLHTKTHKRIKKRFGTWIDISVTAFYYIQTALNIMKGTFIFDVTKNMQPIEYGINSIHNMPTGAKKNKQDMLVSIAAKS